MEGPSSAMKSNRKSQKLLIFVKLLEKYGNVPIHFKCVTMNRLSLCCRLISDCSINNCVRINKVNKKNKKKNKKKKKRKNHERKEGNSTDIIQGKGFS